jgi:hypothetical protein
VFFVPNSAYKLFAELWLKNTWQTTAKMHFPVVVDLEKTKHIGDLPHRNVANSHKLWVFKVIHIKM